MSTLSVPNLGVALAGGLPPRSAMARGWLWTRGGGAGDAGGEGGVAGCPSGVAEPSFNRLCRDLRNRIDKTFRFRILYLTISRPARLRS